MWQRCLNPAPFSKCVAAPRTNLIGFLFTGRAGVLLLDEHLRVVGSEQDAGRAGAVGRRPGQLSHELHLRLLHAALPTPAAHVDQRRRLRRLPRRPHHLHHLYRAFFLFHSLRSDGFLFLDVNQLM